MSAEALIVFFLAGVIMVGGGILASKLLAPSSKNEQKAGHPCF